MNIATRRPMPSPTPIPAASEATPVANGLTVDASTPAPHPRKMIAAPVMRSYPRASVNGTSRAKNPSDSSAMPSVVPAEREHGHEHDDQQRWAVAKAQGQAADAGLDRTRLHRHGDERADRQDEQKDLRCAIQRAGVVDADVAGLVLDAVEAIGRRSPEPVELLYAEGDPYPLDVLDAESEGQIGYVIELELDNAIAHQDTVAVITRVLVDADDPAFGEPTKFIGPVYDQERAQALAAERGWVVKPDGDRWRRVVASPDPKEIVQLDAIRRLVSGGFLVVCAGGGGVPVVAEGGGQVGVEAVIDKDLASALLAIGLGADILVLATDVDAIYSEWGTPQPERRGRHDSRLAARARVRRRVDGAEGRGRLPLRRGDRQASRDRAARGSGQLDRRDRRHTDRR